MIATSGRWPRHEQRKSLWEMMNDRRGYLCSPTVSNSTARQQKPELATKAAMKIIYGVSGARKASYALHVRRSNKAWFEY